MIGAIPIPERMRRLPRDPRGYPIPVIVQRDAKGNPHFTVNDTRAVAKVLRDRSCAICGQPLRGSFWFVGGPLSTFHPEGMYIDTPLHLGCARYALQVCPYLAAPNYSKRIDFKTLKPENMEGHVLLAKDNTMLPDRPAVFVLARARSFTTRRVDEMTVHVRPERPWLAVEFWLKGQRIESDHAQELTRQHPDGAKHFGVLQWQEA